MLYQFNACHKRHFDIRKQNIDRCILKYCQSFFPVLGLNHFQRIFVFPDQELQAGSFSLLIIDNQNFKHISPLQITIRLLCP